MVAQIPDDTTLLLHQKCNTASRFRILWCCSEQSNRAACIHWWYQKYHRTHCAYDSLHYVMLSPLGNDGISVSIITEVKAMSLHWSISATAWWPGADLTTYISLGGYFISTSQTCKQDWAAEDKLYQDQPAEGWSLQRTSWCCSERRHQWHRFGTNSHSTLKLYKFSETNVPTVSRCNENSAEIR